MGMNENIEKVLAILDGFRMSDEMTYPAYSALHDEISRLDDLLKEQEPVEAKVMGESKSHGSWWFACGACGHSIDTEDNFCRECGRKVKWDE